LVHWVSLFCGCIESEIYAEGYGYVYRGVKEPAKLEGDAPFPRPQGGVSPSRALRRSSSGRARCSRTFTSSEHDERDLAPALLVSCTFHDQRDNILTRNASTSSLGHSSINSPRSRLGSFNKASSIAARALRASLKEDKRVAAEKRGATILRYQKWENGQGGEQVRTSRITARVPPRSARRSLQVHFNPPEAPAKGEPVSAAVWRRSSSHVLW
jgi:F-type H+-transporting ATPase subunit epsilon